MHVNEMFWCDAPVWATHIVGWLGEPQTCFWAEKVGSDFYCEKTRGTNISFCMLDQGDHDMRYGNTFGWVVVSDRPSIEAHRKTAND